MHQRSASPLEFMKKINTDRSQHIPFSSRNSESHIFDNSTHKNNSQMLIKNQNKSIIAKNDKRIKSVSSYYFKNCRKNGKNTDTQSFSKYLKEKKQNPAQRKRCITTVNLTTNKISLPTQISQQKQKIIEISQKSKLMDKNQICCKFHPSKVAYFEEQNSVMCYCHKCSIENVKVNKRLIELTPQIQNVREIMMKKIVESKIYGEQLCEMIKQRVNQNVSNLQRQYNAIKMRITSQINNCKSSKDYIDFQLKQIDWSFIKANNKELKEQRLNTLQFLDQITNKYRINKISKLEQYQDNKLQEQIHNLTIDEFNQDIQLSPVIFKSSNQKQKQINNKNWNVDIKPKRNLLNQIQKTLNYQSKNTILKVKTVNLKNKLNQKSYSNIDHLKNNQHQTSYSNINHFNKQNVQPNIITNNNQKQINRLTFGNYI